MDEKNEKTLKIIEISDNQLKLIKIKTQILLFILKFKYPLKIIFFILLSFTIVSSYVNNEISDSNKNKTFELDTNKAFELDKNKIFELDNNKTFEIGKNKTFELDNNKTFEIGKNKTFELDKNKIFEIGKNKTFEFDKNKTFEIGKNDNSDSNKNENTDFKEPKKDDDLVENYNDLYNENITYTPQFYKEGKNTFLTKETINNFNNYMDLCNKGILIDKKKYELNQNPKISVIMPIYNGG